MGPSSGRRPVCSCACCSISDLGWRSDCNATVLGFTAGGRELGADGVSMDAREAGGPAVPAIIHDRAMIKICKWMNENKPGGSDLRGCNSCGLGRAGQWRFESLPALLELVPRRIHLPQRLAPAPASKLSENAATRHIFAYLCINAERRGQEMLSPSIYLPNTVSCTQCA